MGHRKRKNRRILRLNKKARAGRKTLPPVIAVARAQARAAARDEPEQPVAVELDLMDPFLALPALYRPASPIALPGTGP